MADRRVSGTARRLGRRLPHLAVGASLAALATLAACGPAGPITSPANTSPTAGSGAQSRPASPAARGGTAAGNGGTASRGKPPLPTPAALASPGARTYPAEGQWRPAGRLVTGFPAVYETTVVPPGGTQRAGIAWLDSKLLSARLYSGSLSPGGVGYKYTAPIAPAQAASLVAAFNGGFKMADAHGGYYTEGRLIAPLVTGDASLVIDKNGSATVGAWGTDVTMTPAVAAVRQNLVPLVAGGQPTALAASPDWQAWGDTCGFISCAHSVPGIEQQWRTGLGVTANGALVFVLGPALDPFQLAKLLVLAGAVRAMELDINPGWPDFSSYRPATANGLAAPSNGSTLLSTNLGAGTFFDPSYNRDFITMSARRVVGS